ncbi:Dabb family protein [Microbacterium sp. NPDC058062]|uniref:Dabb family protein n=1 Tax=Microbacterium sp. NPDC058062 TaxID=3346320 RepID=UPI0036D7DF80
MSFRHIVLFRIREGVGEAEIEGAQSELRALSSSPEVIRWRIERSSDYRKGTILIEDATFADVSAFTRFRETPAHRAAGARLASIADWWIGDYEE